MWPFKRSSRATAAPTEAEPVPHWLGALSTHARTPEMDAADIAAFNAELARQPAPALAAMDAADLDGSGHVPYFKLAGSEIPDALLGWYAAQRFIGYQTCAMISQHWLVDKACTMPARDAIRHGFDINVYSDDAALPAEQQADIIERLKRADRRHRLFHNMREFVRMGRIFGVRVAFFKIRNARPDFYEKPFNLDGVTPGSYEGIVQVDPYWCIPLLSGEAASDPASMHFYEPEWWIIRGQKYHRSHLLIFRNGELPDILKPMYVYGGIPVPQKIMERVYAAERTANEGPQLAMTKRTNVQNTDLAQAYSNQEQFIQHMQQFAYYRDNYGVKLIDTDDTMTQFDTSLADLDAVIMTQYQIVAAASGVPATKLLGTTPKGFNATGEYEAESYHEELESIQANDLTEFVERHHAIVMRSDVGPALRLDPRSVRVEIDWLPVDSPSAKEYAEINKINAETDSALLATGAIDAIDIRNRLRGDNNSGYADLPELEMGDPEALGAVGGDPEDEAAAEAAAEPPETTSGTVLNGAQVTALIGVVSQVAKGELPRSSGIEIMKSAYRLPAEEAERLMGEAGTNGTEAKNPAITDPENLG